jgi:hypothetical protein
MADREKVLNGLEACADRTGALCRTCPYDFRKEGCISDMAEDALELLKEQVSELTRRDLDMLVDAIGQKAKAEGRFFSPYEVGLALVQRGQHDERFKWGEVIKYSPSEVEQILNEVINDARKNS